jgi:hypothetical protein
VRLGRRPDLLAGDFVRATRGNRSGDSIDSR